MRLLIEISGQIETWHRALAAAADRPRLPLPFSSSAAFVARGHEVSAIHFSDSSFSSRERGQFRKLYGPGELKGALRETDVAFFWAGSGIKAIASNLKHSYSQKKVLLGSYVWRVPGGTACKVH